MSIAQRALTPLRILLVAVLSSLLLAQVLLVVGITRLSTEGAAELVQFRYTVLVVLALGLVGAEVVVVSTWRLLSLVRRDRIFTVRAMPWVDAIVGAFVGVEVLLLLAVVPVFRFAEVDDAPGLGGLHLVLLLLGAVPVLLMLVMRELLRQATTLRSDMEAVV